MGDKELILCNYAKSDSDEIINKVNTTFNIFRVINFFNDFRRQIYNPDLNESHTAAQSLRRPFEVILFTIKFFYIKIVKPVFGVHIALT